ncbi:helix-turn-helix domain-containing protein [Polaromonas sp.]|uniref:helix-turn-helix domain-containing protein n=1 Tax=Polaromonas sp. TaxID=1869339 RepID=UPI00248860F5|nr:helix-turn-helix domain-containing protein [Polaromonas sp.]MDI1341814.1 helix-turn-helix domain-containing protein [Polaromonas sp.]
MTDADGLLPGNAAMTQRDPAPHVPLDQADGGPAVSAGSLIRQAREAAGLHIAALAVALKVPVKKLEALEADRLDLLPDAVFVRALAASVCRTLKIDAGQVLTLLPQTGKPNLGQQSAPINAPFRSPGDGPGPSLVAQISRPAVLAGLLLVLGALVLIFLPAVQQPGVATQPATPSPAVADAPAAPSGGQSGVAMARTELIEVDKPAGTDSMAQPATPGGTALAAPLLAPRLPATDQAAVVMSPAVASPAAASAPAAAAGIIVFRAKGESWVEVTDARGTVVLRRTLAAGEEAGASGVLPLAAVVGRVDATQVEVRGKAFDLGAVSKDNVARFEVK